MKKILSLLLALTMTAGCLVGCGGSDKPTDAPEAENTGEATFKIGGIGPITGGAAIYGQGVMNAAELAGYDIWVAHYANVCGFKGRYHMWQYTSSGSVPGIKGRVDLNIRYVGVVGN